MSPVIAAAASIQCGPSVLMPARSTSWAKLVRRIATRVLALPQVAGRSSRGRAQRVRRMASCLRRVRSS
jgi:hypothetical protein